MTASTTVFVSGATGFIAKHVVKDLIKKNYNVVGSVRSSEKGDHLAEQLNSDKFCYEVVADISVPGAFDQCLKNHPEITVFLHTASPFHFYTDNVENDLLKPAIEGTHNALNAIKKYGPQIERVVITSSVAAMASFEQLSNPNHVVNENSWNEVSWEKAISNPFDGYFGSKTFAEKAAWDFVKTEKPNFILSTVNPSYVFGPQAFDEDAKGTLGTSAEVITGLLRLRKEEDIPNQRATFIDVRDVSNAHIVAFESDDAKENRLVLVAAKEFSSQELLDIIHSNFDQFSEVPVGKPGTKSGQDGCIMDTKETLNILKTEFIGLEKSVVDSIQQYSNANN